MEKLLLKDNNSGIRLEIKPYDNGWSADIKLDSEDSTDIKEIPFYGKISRLLNAYDFKECGDVHWSNCTPCTYCFRRHDKTEGVKLNKMEFIINDFKRDFEQIINIE